MLDAQPKVTLQKAELRKIVRLLKRDFFAETPFALQKALSGEVLGRLEATPEFQEARVVLLYYSLPDELYTHDFVARWADLKTILLPRVLGDKLTLHRYHDNNSMTPGAYGILEPTTPEYLVFSDIDLVVVPGVAFDLAGNRLGRGRGYYDKLFAHTLPAGICKIGVCYPFQLVECVPAEPNDVPMDKVIV